MSTAGVVSRVVSDLSSSDSCREGGAVTCSPLAVPNGSHVQSVNGGTAGEQEGDAQIQNQRSSEYNSKRGEFCNRDCRDPEQRGGDTRKSRSESSSEEQTCCRHDSTLGFQFKLNPDANCAGEMTNCERSLSVESSHYSSADPDRVPRTGLESVSTEYTYEDLLSKDRSRSDRTVGSQESNPDIITRAVKSEVTGPCFGTSNGVMNGLVLSSKAKDTDRLEDSTSSTTVGSVFLYDVADVLRLDTSSAGQY
ncbi:hypothetical protein RRG08_055315 [Elysia crispata]|uniref:Uncharacterized protein n=1 Tax=Elysia crispata TaxID=231223 RepID=A0AAE1AQL5_9GAST|nr:hypothetical protein RRG08_055315 [Elysia crispata]